MMRVDAGTAGPSVWPRVSVLRSTTVRFELDEGWYLAMWNLGIFDFEM